MLHQENSLPQDPTVKQAVQAIKIEYIKSQDLLEVARLYEKAFDDHFLGHMGQDFLKYFCAQFVNTSQNYGYVAKCEGKPVGFLLGTIAKDPLQNFYRQNLPVLSWLVLKRYLMDAYVRQHITKRLGNVKIVFKSILPSKEKSAAQGQVSDLQEAIQAKPARLLAIAVDQNYRGMGIADRLTGQFCAEMKREGYKKVGLSVLPWNERAISFYKKDGWVLEENRESSLYFSRTI